MPRLFLNREATSANGAIKPCQRPSQKPATTPCVSGVPRSWLADGAQPARKTASDRTLSRETKERFMEIPPDLVTGDRLKKSQSRVGVVTGVTGGRAKKWEEAWVS